MSIRYHPRSELLLSYATGALDEAAAVLMATHLALCPRCRAAVGRMESVGGALLDALPDDTADEQNLARVMTRLDETVAGRSAYVRPDSKTSSAAMMLPQPLRGYVNGDPDARLPWRRLMHLEYLDLKTRGRGRGRLLRVSPGRAIPYHGHGGDELVLVLAGGYSDTTGTYHRGDVASADPSLAHEPVAESDEACVCMTVNYGWLLPTRILAPLAHLFRGSR